MLLERHVDGTRQHLVRWAPHPICDRDADVFANSKLRYKCSSRDPLPPSSPYLGQGYDSLAHWEPTWEPEDNITDHPNGLEKLRQYRERRKAANECARPARRKDEHLTNVERQGHWPKLSTKIIHPLILQPALHAYIDINPMSSINPDRDVEATGQFEVVHSRAEERLADVFSPNGKFFGSILLQRLAVLQTSYRHLDTTNRYANGGAHRSSFPQEIAELLLRYQDGHVAGKVRTKLKNHWATPDAYMQALIEGLSLDIERFASPLNFTPSMDWYFSLYPEDQAFGMGYRQCTKCSRLRALPNCLCAAMVGGLSLLQVDGASHGSPNH